MHSTPPETTDAAPDAAIADAALPDAATARRRARMATLARAPRELLEGALAALGTVGWERLRGPEAGMVMVRGRMGGVGAAFNLGEMTVTRCAVRLDDGRIGHAYRAGRDLRAAELAAVLDAAALGGAVPAPLAAALAAMDAAEDATRDDRSRRAAATRVDFYGMVRMG